MLSAVISVWEEVPIPWIPVWKGLPPQQNSSRWHCSRRREKSQIQTFADRGGLMLKFSPWTVTGALTVLGYNSTIQANLQLNHLSFLNICQLKIPAVFKYFCWVPLCIICLVLNRARIRNGTKEKILFYFTTDFKGSGCAVSRKMYKCTLKWKKLDKQKLSSRNIDRKWCSLGCNTFFKESITFSAFNTQNWSSGKGLFVFPLPFFCKNSQLIRDFQKVQENLVKIADHKNPRQMFHKFMIFHFFSQIAE